MVKDKLAELQWEPMMKKIAEDFVPWPLESTKNEELPDASDNPISTIPDALRVDIENIDL